MYNILETPIYCDLGKLLGYIWKGGSLIAYCPTETLGWILQVY